MDQMDLLYSLSRHHKEALQSDSDYMKTVSAIKTLRKNGSVDCKFRECSIDKKWIETIEELLPYVEKSIGENRHFIKQYGEVVRIDQVKKVSANSVEHLSRHSNYLTQKKSGEEEYMPEKLYVSEITDNYQLYENRFIYTLLVFLKDFIQTRYNEIVSEISSSFYELEFDGDISTGTETYTLKLNMTEKNPVVGSGSADFSGSDEVLRINAALETVSGLLETPLMKNVAPLSTLTPPITATNIIKKDPNFQLAYRLWDFIMNYNGKGYEFSEKHKVISPVTSETAENLAVVLSVMSLSARAEAQSLYASLAEKADRRGLKEMTGNPDIDDLKSRLLLEKEKNDDLTHTLGVVSILNETTEECMEKIHSLEEKIAALQNELDLRNAENTALRIQNGQFSKDDHTEEAEFTRLSAEKEILDEYYASKYPAAKKKLRKKYIWNKFKEK